MSQRLRRRRLRARTSRASGERAVQDAGVVFFDLTRDPREERSAQSIKYGTWAGGQFASMVKRHMATRKKYADRKPVHGVPYEGIENLRPETKEMVKAFMAGKPGK